MAKTYDTYKDSGIAWIGEIPGEWRVDILSLHLYDHCLYNDHLKENNLLSLSYGRIIRKDINTKEGLLPSSFNRYNIIDKGDIVLRLTDLQNDKKSLRTGLCKERGIITSAYLTLRNRGYDDSSFLHYLLHTYDLCKVFYGMGNGVRQGMNYSDVRKFKIPCPPLSVQQSISSFLDTKCGEIDSLISLQEEMISELQAYKQSVITEAVTKGLDKNVKMKDSGVEWIGEIPENWNLLPIRALFTKRNQKNNPILSTERLSLSIGVGITKYADKTTNLDRFKDDFTAYKLAYPEDIVLNSMNMIVGAVGKSAYMGCVSPVYYVITAKEFVDPNFYGYLLNCARIREAYHSLGRGIYAIERGEGRVNTCRLKVPYYNFSIIKVPVPSYKEQVKIASYIKEKMEQIDSLIALKQQKITELKDYKKSIIYECVTGKKEVV